MVQKLVPYILLCIVRAFYMKIETYLNESALWMFFDTLFTSENLIKQNKISNAEAHSETRQTFKIKLFAK